MRSRAAAVVCLMFADMRLGGSLYKAAAAGRCGGGVRALRGGNRAGETAATITLSWKDVWSK